MRVPFEPNILRLRQRKKITAEGAKGAKEKARSIQQSSTRSSDNSRGAIRQNKICEPCKGASQRRSVLRLSTPSFVPFMVWERVRWLLLLSPLRRGQLWIFS